MIENLNKMIIILSIICGLGISGLSYSAPFANQDEKATINVYEKANPSIVAVDGELLLNNMSSGTGVIIDPSGIILTSSHVVLDVSKIDVTFYDNQKVKAKVKKQFCLIYIRILMKKLDKMMRGILMYFPV